MCSVIYNLHCVFVCCCNQCIWPLTLWVRIPLRRGVYDPTLRDKVCQSFAACLLFSSGTLVSSTNKTDCHDITEILLKVALNTITLVCSTPSYICKIDKYFKQYSFRSYISSTHDICVIIIVHRYYCTELL